MHVGLYAHGYVHVNASLHVCIPTNQNLLVPPSEVHAEYLLESFHAEAAARCRYVHENVMFCQLLQVTIKSSVRLLVLAGGKTATSPGDSMPYLLKWPQPTRFNFAPNPRNTPRTSPESLKPKKKKRPRT